MASSKITGNLHVTGQLSCNTFVPPENSIGDDAVSASDPLGATKVKHQHKILFTQATGAVVVPEERIVHIAQKAATIVSVEAVLALAPDGSSSFTIDVKKSTGAGAFSSILTSVVTFNSSSVDRTLQAATLSGTPTLVDGDLLQVVIAEVSEDEDIGEGLAVVITLDENPDS